MAKRLFDLAVASMGLVVLSPLFVVLAILIKLDSPGPVFYRGLRVGQGGLLFRMLKFRSMVQQAEQDGPGFTADGDPRVTRLGRVLRRTKLDELPQLINVLRGEMSMVGPRPEDPRYVALYAPEQRRVLDVRPGITSQASVQYRHEEAMLARDDAEDIYVATLMPDKLRIELAYMDHMSLWTDLKVIAMTIHAVLQRHRNPLQNKS